MALWWFFFLSFHHSFWFCSLLLMLIKLYHFVQVGILALFKALHLQVHFFERHFQMQTVKLNNSFVRFLYGIPLKRKEKQQQRVRKGAEEEFFSCALSCSKRLTCIKGRKTLHFGSCRLLITTILFTTFDGLQQMERKSFEMFKRESILSIRSVFPVHIGMSSVWECFLCGINAIPTPLSPNLMGIQLDFTWSYGDLHQFFTTVGLQPSVTSTLTK